MAKKKRATRKRTGAVGVARSPSDVRSEAKRRKRELPAQLTVLKAELALTLARARKAHRERVQALRSRATVAGVRRGK
jgi:hypothetical protein